MKLSTLALTASALFASATAFAGTLHFSDNIDVVALDGQKVKKGFLKKAKDLSVDAGQHQLVIRVSEVVKEGSDQRLYESSPLVVTFNGSRESINITTPRLENSHDVDAFEKAPNLKMTTQSGQTLATQLDWLPQEGFLPGKNIVEHLAEYNASQSKASVMSFAVQPMMPLTPAQKVNTQSAKAKVVVAGENIAEQQLQYWFQQADPATQQRFLNWAKAQ